MNIEILKGKLLKGDRKNPDVVEIDYRKRESSEAKWAKVSEEHKDPPRKQFRQAFEALRIHAALIGEFIPNLPSLDHDDPALTKDFTVSGFSLSGEGDKEGVILTAQKTLSTGKTMGFNTPLIRLQDASENAYPYVDELWECLDVCKSEIREYLKGNYGEEEQPELPFDVKASENGTEPDVEVPVKRGRKAKEVTA